MAGFISLCMLLILLFRGIFCLLGYIIGIIIALFKIVKSICDRKRESPEDYCYDTCTDFDLSCCKEESGMKICEKISCLEAEHKHSNIYIPQQTTPTADISELRHNFALYLDEHGISRDSSWYDAFYLHRHCGEIDFFELLNIEDFNYFQYLAYTHLNKTLMAISTAKGSNISCYIRGITLLWKHIHNDETPYIPYKHNQNPYY